MRLVVSFALGLAATSPLIAALRAPSKPELRVVSSGSEQSLKLGDTMLARPFGAQLVDTMTVIGRYGAGRDSYFLVEGTAGASCPARYLIVRATPGKAPVASAPFGTCGLGATARDEPQGLVVSVAPGPNDHGPLRYLYARGSVRLLDAPPPAPAAATVLSCRGPRGMSPAGQGAVLAEFDRTFPESYRTMHAVRRADIPPAQLDEMIAGLACFASWPGNDKMVAKAATPLFASKRYGAASFAALERIARTEDATPDMRASARIFAATMYYQIGHREPL